MRAQDPWRRRAGAAIGLCRAATGAPGRAVHQAHRNGWVASIYGHEPDRQTLRECIGWLREAGFRFLSARELLERIEARRDTNESAAFLSMDDGWRSNLDEVLPVIEEFCVPLTLFVPTEPVEAGVFWWTWAERYSQCLPPGWHTLAQLKVASPSRRRELLRPLREQMPAPSRECLTRHEVAALARHPLVTIGGHGHEHNLLPTCDEQELERELVEAKRMLEAWTGTEVFCLAYPNGSHNNRTRRKVRECGYRMAFTIRPDFLRVETCDPLALPRFCIINGSLRENACRMTGTWPRALLRGERDVEAQTAAPENRAGGARSGR